MDDTLTNYKEVRWVLADRQNELKKRVSAMQRKAQKLGLPEPMMKFTGNKEVFQLPVYQDGHELEAKIPVLKVEVEFSGSIPKIDGFQFLAKIDHTKGKDGTYSNLLNTAGSASEEILENLGTNFHVCTPNCDHCEKPRARNTTYLVRNPEDGDIKQIGSTCVDDFIGTKTLKQIMGAFDMHAMFLDDEYYDELDRDYVRGGASPTWFPIKTYLAMASYLTDTIGFVKADSYDPKPTRQVILEEISRPGSQNNSVLTKLSLEAFTPTLKDAVYDKVDAMIDHFKTSKQTSTYGLNIQSLLNDPYFELNNRFACGILASVPSAYNREMERNRQMQPEIQQEALNEPFGDVKARGRLKLRLVNIRDGQNRLGHSITKFSFLDEHSRRFHWRASSYPDIDMTIGKTYELTATIAKHSVYQDVHYTHINRCADFELSSPDAPTPDFGKKVKAKSIDKIKSGITMENGDGIVDGHSYFFVEREWKEGRHKQDIFLQFPFPLPPAKDFQASIVKAIAEFVENYPDVERDPNELHTNDVSFVNAVLERSEPYRELTYGLTSKLPGNLFLVERADIAPFKDLPRPFHSQSLGNEGGKLFTSFSSAEAAGRDLKQGRLLGFDVGQQKPLLIPLLLSEKGYTQDDGHLTTVIEKAIEHGYTHMVTVNDAGQNVQNLPLGWDLPAFQENCTPSFIRALNQPGDISLGNQSLDGERFIFVVGLQDRDTLNELNKLDPSHMTKLLHSNVVPEINGSSKKDFLGLSPASEFLYGLSEDTKLNLRTKTRLMAFTDPITPEVIKRNGGNVLTLGVIDENGLDNCFQRSVDGMVDFSVTADTLSPESVKSAIQNWIESQPAIHNDLKQETPKINEDERNRNAFKR